MAIRQHKAPQHAYGITHINTATLIELASAGEQLPLKSVNIRALQSGGYVSTFKGRGMEFVESRLYQPGDDIRSLDWKVTARTGKTHTKLFQEERERPVLLWTDLHKSMFFATRGAFKSVVAAKAAALLGWSAAAHNDRLGGLIFSEYTHQELKPHNGRSAVLRYIKSLCEHPAWQNILDTNIDEKNTLPALKRLQNVARPGSLIFMLSDFKQLNTTAENIIGQIARHNDIVLIHISDPMEQSLPPPGQYRFSNGHRELTIDTSSTKTITQYQERYQKHKEKLKHLCRKYRMFYLPLSTNDDIKHVLQTRLGLKSNAI